ncbi:phosphonate ABC transporter, permease protein PhnE [Bacillus carboniphilus]|uniref:Phosphonate ABC transporter, permease protein PhnE n=1 Tax=Bacillus carboniphilus TaxID=86663 RepID=A0ABP3FUW6_9BACI
MNLEKKGPSKAKVPSLVPAKKKAQITAIFAVVLGFYFWSAYKTESTIPELVSGIPDMQRVIGFFFPPNWAVVSKIWASLAETIQMAVIATSIAAILTIPLCLLAASNITTNKFVYTFVRSILNILRTIPDIVLAVVFVGLFGIGVLPGILALIIFSLGILAKLISETIESIDMNPLEAMKASGAGSIQTIGFAVVPQVLPQFISFTLYVFEINIRASVVLGLVGAGGIGTILNSLLNFRNFEAAMAVIIVIFVVVVVIEYISKKLREALI